MDSEKITGVARIITGTRHNENLCNSLYQEVQVLDYVLSLPIIRGSIQLTQVLIYIFI